MMKTLTMAAAALLATPLLTTVGTSPANAAEPPSLVLHPPWAPFGDGGVLDAVLAGGEATVAAEVLNGDDSWLYRWSLDGPCTADTLTGPSILVSCPASAGGQALPVAVEAVRDADGDGVGDGTAADSGLLTRSITLDVLAPFSLLGIAGPTSLPYDSEAVYSTRASDADAALTWAADQPACEVVPAGASATLACGPAFPGGEVLLTVTATNSAGDVASRAITVYVDQPPIPETEPVVLQDTRLALRARAGYTTVFRGRLTDATGHPVAGARVLLERRRRGRWSPGAAAVTDADGRVVFRSRLAGARVHRLRYAGDRAAGLRAGVSPSRRPRVWTTIQVRRPSTRTLWARPVAVGRTCLRGVTMTLQARRGTRWLRVRRIVPRHVGECTAVRTSVRPKRSTVYRWRWAGNGDYRPGVSKRVWVRGRR